MAGDGSSGEDGDTDERHGTLMAMVAGAPRNGFGMVGTWSQLKLVGVRASNKGEDDFPFTRYRTGIQKCRELRQDGHPIKVIELALGGSEAPGDSDLARLEDTIDQARADGINVIGAAGNDGDGSVIYPARVDEVLAVGASEGDGDFCDFSNRGEGLDLKAPGCGLDTADPKDGDETTTRGTSQASAIAAATIAALRTYDEDIDVEEAEELVLQSADDGNLDIKAAFRRAGLDGVIEAGKGNVPDRDDSGSNNSDDRGDGNGGGDSSSGGSGGGGGSDSCGEPGDAGPLAPPPPTLAALPAPSFSHVVRRGVLLLRLRNRPP
ncbi:MAG: S8 family serine peptidase, partial [Solirubrobacteraceae bacterium]